MNCFEKVKGQYEDGKSGGHINQINSNGMMGANILNTLNNSQRLAGISDAAMSHYAIEPAEDESIEEAASARQVAQGRFNRNHRLLNDIFNEYTVADNRSIITSQRMEQLKKQVNSLELHQTKLKQELQLIEDKFEMKKKRILDASDEFQNEIDKLNKFKINEEELKKFYTKHYEQLQRQWKEQVERLPRNDNFNHEIEMLKMSIESIVSNNKALLTIPAASSVSLVALQQVIEVAPSPAPASSVAPAATAQQPPTPTPQQTNQQQPPGGAAMSQSGPNPTGMPFPAGHHPQTLPNQQMYHQQMLHHHHQQQQQQQQQHMMHPGPQHNVQQAHHMQQPHHVPPVVAPPPVTGQQHQNQQAHLGGPAPAPPQPPHNLMQQQPPSGPPQPATPGEYPPGYNPNQLNHQAYPQVYPPQQQHQQQQPPLDINQQQPQNSMYPGMSPQMYSAQHHQQYGMQQQQQYQMQQQQQQQQQRGVPANPGFISQPPVINQQGARFNAPAAAPSQPPMQPNQSQMMAMNRPPLPGVQQAPPNMSANMASNPQVPNPTQMPGNQAPSNQVPNQAYSNFIMSQPQFNQQQQYRSTNTPPTNAHPNTPTSMVS